MGWGCHQKFEEVGVDVKIVVFSLFFVVELGLYCKKKSSSA